VILVAFLPLFTMARSAGKIFFAPLSLTYGVRVDRTRLFALVLQLRCFRVVGGLMTRVGAGTAPGGDTGCPPVLARSAVILYRRACPLTRGRGGLSASRFLAG